MAGPYFSTSSRGEELWSNPYHCFGVRGARSRYAETKFAIRKVAAWLGGGVGGGWIGAEADVGEEVVAVINEASP